MGSLSRRQLPHTPSFVSRSNPSSQHESHVSNLIASSFSLRFFSSAASRADTAESVGRSIFIKSTPSPKTASNSSIAVAATPSAPSSPAAAWKPSSTANCCCSAACSRSRVLRLRHARQFARISPFSARQSSTET